jgi:yeast amino acid transporter
MLRVGFPILYFGAKFYKKVSFVKYPEMDFETSVDDFDQLSQPDETPRNIVEKVWLWLM